MKISRLLAAMLMISFSAQAYAQRIPDYSLPATAAAQPSNSTNNTPRQYQNQNNQSAQQHPYNNYPAPLLTDNDQPTSSRYMDRYCDRNFKPAIASDPRYANLGACLEQQKELVCSQFQQLPRDVQKVLDETISCTNRLLNGEDPDEQQTANIPTTCGDGDSTRLQLLKKYWRDPNTS